MVFILGVDVPAPMVVRFALRKFEGVGPATAQRVCDKASIHQMCKVRELNENQIDNLRGLLTNVIEEARREKLEKMKMDKMRSKKVEIPKKVEVPKKDPAALKKPAAPK